MSNRYRPYRVTRFHGVVGGRRSRVGPANHVQGENEGYRNQQSPDPSLPVCSASSLHPRNIRYRRLSPNGFFPPSMKVSSNSRLAVPAFRE